MRLFLTERRMLRIRSQTAWIAGVLGFCVSFGAPGPAAAGGLLEPSSFASLGTLPDESGTYSINTGGSTPVMTLPDGTTINGVIDPSGQVAVFTFNSITLDGTTGLTIDAGFAWPCAFVADEHHAAEWPANQRECSAGDSWSRRFLGRTGRWRQHLRRWGWRGRTRWGWRCGPTRDLLLQSNYGARANDVSGRHRW